MKIVCLGDSITGHPNLAAYLKWSFILECMIEAKNDEGSVSVVNRGIGGDTIEGALKRLQGDVLEQEPNIVIVLLGGNDAGQKRTQEALKADLKSIVEQCKGIGAKVLMMQYVVLPNPAQSELAWTHLDANNGLIAEVAKAEEIELLDLAGPMNAALENQQVTEFKGRGANGIAIWETKPVSQAHLVSATDGVHLNPGGELVFARNIFKKLVGLGWL